MSADTPSIAVYAGTFDPITNGHVDILERSLALFDEVIVAIASNIRKQPLFTLEERTGFIKQATRDNPRVRCDAFEGLLVEYCARQKARFIVRGLRALADFEYEFQFAHMNRRLAPGVDTVFFMTAVEYGYVSSSLVKEIASFDGDVSAMIPAAALGPLMRALAARG